MKKKPAIMTVNEEQIRELRFLLSCLAPRQKTFANLDGIDIPDLSALTDRVTWAIDNPGCYYPHYLGFINEDLATIERVVSLCRAVMAAKLPGHNKTALEENATKEKYTARTK